MLGSYTVLLSFYCFVFHIHLHCFSHMTYRLIYMVTKFKKYYNKKNINTMKKKIIITQQVFQAIFLRPVHTREVLLAVLPTENVAHQQTSREN